MPEENALGPKTGNPPSDTPAGASGVLAGRWAFGLASALVLLLAAVEGAHWVALTRQPGVMQIVRLPAPVSSPTFHPDVSAPDPGDNP